MIRALLKKDLIRKLHNPGGYLLMLAMPLIFTLLMGVIFSPDEKENILPKATLLIVDRDSSFISEMMTGMFNRGEMARMFYSRIVPQDSGLLLIENDKASALLTIPAGFQDSLLEQQSCTVTLVKNPGQQFAPKIAEETVKILCLGADRLFRVGAEPINMVHSLFKAEKWPDNLQMTALLSSLRLLFNKQNNYINPPLIKLDEETAVKNDKATPDFNIFTYLLSGMIVMFLLFNLDTLARDIFREKENMTMFRIVTGPVSITDFVVSKQMFLYLSGAIAFYLVWLVAILFFKIHITLPQLLLFLIFSIIMIAGMTGIIGLFYSLVKTRAQGSAIASAVILCFSITGGAMIPMESLPQFIKKIAVFSPVFWGVDGLQKILIENFGLLQLTKHFIILIILAIILNTCACILYERKFRS